MKMKILFVDDESNVLDGLRRILRGFRNEWDMAFANHGAEALAHLEAHGADVIVTDMRMPSMDGDILLARVRERFPRTVRIVLTGQCTQEARLRIAAIAHRILTKPCDPQELCRAIHESTALLMLLHQPALQDAIGKLGSVPTQPGLYVNLLETIDSANSSLAEISALIVRDIGVAAKVMQIANSSLFGGLKPVNSVTDSVLRIGTEMVKALVLTDGIFSLFNPSTLNPYSIDDLWAHSQQAALLAAEIAKSEDCSNAVLNQVHAAALLHDIGRIIMAVTQPRQYIEVLRRIQKEHLTVIQAEKAVFGVTHAEVGAYLLSLWGMPTPIVEAIAWHHTPVPSECPEFHFGLNAILHVTDAILSPGESDILDLPFLERLGKEHRLPIWRDLMNRLQEEGYAHEQQSTLCRR